MVGVRLVAAARAVNADGGQTERMRRVACTVHLRRCKRVLTATARHTIIAEAHLTYIARQQARTQPTACDFTRSRGAGRNEHFQEQRGNRGVSG